MSSAKRQKTATTFRRVILIQTTSAFSARPQQRKVYEMCASRGVLEIWQGVAGGSLKYQKSKMKNAVSILESTRDRKLKAGFELCGDYSGPPKAMQDVLPEDVQRMLFRYLDLPSICRARRASSHLNTLVDSSAHLFPAYTRLRISGLNQLTGALLSSWAPEVRALRFAFDFRHPIECAKRDRIIELVAGCCPALEVLDLRRCRFPEKFAEYGDIVPEIRTKLEMLVREVHFSGGLDDEDLENFEKLANAQNSEGAGTEGAEAVKAPEGELTPYHCKVLVPPRADEREKFPPGESRGVFFVSVLPQPAGGAGEAPGSEFVSAAVAQIVG